jgi:hypothetical protein
MKTFIDTETQQIWQFEDDVADIFQFATTPATLIPYVIPDVPSTVLLENAKSVKIQELTAAYENALDQDVSYNGHIYQADLASRNQLATVLAVGSVPSNFFWKTLANEKIPMTYIDLQELAGVMLIQGFVAFDKLDNLKTTTRSLTTVADINLVEWAS